MYRVGQIKQRHPSPFTFASDSWMHL